MQTKSVNLRVRILLPLAVGLVCLLAVFVTTVIEHYMVDIDDEVLHSRDTIQQIFSQELSDDASMMLAMASLMQRDTGLLKAFRRADRRALFDAAHPIFRKLTAEHRVTHLYFTDTRRINLLRVHQPPRYGDEIRRYTMLEAEKTGQPAWGIELGPLGTFTLRVVVPWYDNDKLVGYLELGEEIEHIMQKLHAMTKSEFYVVIEKKWLARGKWEEGMKMLGRAPEWDFLPSSVVAYRSNADASGSLNGRTLHEMYEAERKAVYIGTSSYDTFTVPLIDAGNNRVGSILVLYNTTAQAAGTIRIAFINTLAGLVVGSVLFVLIAIILLRTEKLIDGSRADLVREMSAREKLQRQHLAEMEHISLHDVLTGMPNRNLLLDRLRYSISIAKRENMPLSLFFIHIHGLRDINDTLGHQNGDRVLQQVGLRLQETLTESDTVARVDSNVFGVVVPGVGKEYVRDLADRVHATLDAPIMIEQIPISIESPMGVAVYPDHGDDADSLLQHADIAMHNAKTNKAAFVVYDQQRDPYSRRRLLLASELRQAISSGELLLHYQPKMSVTSGEVRDVEALVRWNRPNEGLVPPGDFIQIAEQTGLIKPLTLWVVDEALRQIALWQKSGINIRVAVNLSVRNLLDVNLPQQVAGLLRGRNVDPSMLVMEITESAIMIDPMHAVDILLRLKEMGIALSIDDFGTGYSSLAYLSKLPISELKIDQSFVFGMAENENDAMIVRSTIDLGHNLGLHVIAEGVETRHVWNKLAAMGCDVAQGYYINRPLPAADLEEWLAGQIGPRKIFMASQ